jgi:hypothetical protein
MRVVGEGGREGGREGEMWGWFLIHDFFILVYY